MSAEKALIKKSRFESLSIRTRLETLKALEQNVEAVVITPCEQHFVSLPVINQLNITRFEKIVNSKSDR